MSQPEQMLTITGLTGIWKIDKPKVDRLRKYLRQAAVHQHWAWVIEVNPKGTGAHLHAWSWGTNVSESTLRTAALRAGLGGKVQAKPITHFGGLDYLMKNATHNEASLGAHLQANGKELLHTRGFFRDLATGEFRIIQRKAVTLARAYKGDRALPTSPAAPVPLTRQSWVTATALAPHPANSGHHSDAADPAPASTTTTATQPGSDPYSRRREASARTHRTRCTGSVVTPVVQRATPGWSAT